MAQQLFGDRVILAYLPYDLPFAVKRFLRHFQPQFGVLMEMEIWPNLVHYAAHSGVPLYLVNARLSARSQAGYAKVAGLMRPALQALAVIAAQSEADADRLRAIGARDPVVVGNLKFDFLPDEAQLTVGRQWRSLFGPRPVWVAASTREGEEALLLDALARKSLPANALLILVPRHPQRFDEVEALLVARKLRVQRRSAWTGDAPLMADTQVLLGDSMGELASYYAAADVALVGGSLLDFGSHNVIEPCSIGAPTLVGPSSYNFADAINEAVKSGAARQSQDVDALLNNLVELLANGAVRAQMSEAGVRFVNEHRGALARTLALLPDMLA
jgi:3-deoxy-D-manno-octulosonic-acid transferase